MWSVRIEYCIEDQQTLCNNYIARSKDGYCMWKKKCLTLCSCRNVFHLFNFHKICWLLIKIWRVLIIVVQRIVPYNARFINLPFFCWQWIATFKHEWQRMFLCLPQFFSIQIQLLSNWGKGMVLLDCSTTTFQFS